MSKLRKLSLRQLDEVELSKRQESLLLGGGTPGECKCGSCSTTGSAPSTGANLNANKNEGYYITGDNEPLCVCPSKDNVYSIAAW